MSLGKIGKLTNTLKSGTGKDLITSLAGFSDINTAAKWLARSNAGKTYKTKDLKNMLYGAYKNTSTREEASSIFDAALLNSTVEGKMRTGESKIANAFTGLGAFLKSIWPILAVAGGIAAGTAAWKWADDKFTLTKATAKKHSDESAQAYQDAKTELSTKQSQYDTNQDRIHELRATQNRTSDESAELSQLTKENSLLGTQVSVQKKLVDAKAQQQAIDADMNLNKKYTTSQAVANEYSDSVVAKQEDIVEETTRKVNELSELQKKRDAAYQKLDQMSADDKGFTEQQNIAKQMDSRVSKKQSEIADAMDEISNDYDRLFDEDTGTLINPKTKDTAKSVEDLFSLYGRVTDSAQEETDRINNIFAKAKFDGVEDQLVNAGKSGGTDAVKAKILEIDGLQEALDNAGISADTLASNIMAIARPDEKNLEGIKENLKDIFDISADLNEGDNFVGPSGNLYNFFNDKTDKQIEDFWNYYSEQGLDGSDWNYLDLVSNYKKSQEKVKAEEEAKTFSSLFKNSAEDTATDLDTITDTFQTDMSNIKSSMDSIKSGTFQNSDITDLIQQFPELATETDNLQQGLQNLAFDKASDAIGKIRDSVKDVTDPKQLAAADKYVQSIMDTMDLSGMSMNDMKSQIQKNISTNAENEHMVDQTISNLMDKYGNDEYAVQAILKLSVDEEFVNDSLDDQIAKIEDTKIQCHVDVDTKNLDELSKSLTRLQTEATQMQTDMNDKATLNQKVTASDYKDLIKNGDSQIANLNRQIAINKDLQTTVTAGSEQYKQYQDQIDAANSSIKSMQVSQVEWQKTAFNLPLTDMQNTTTALTTAISEMQTETGLTVDTMDSLRTQFSDLNKAHVDTVFDRTAKGLKINTSRMKDYLEQQNKFMNSDFTKKIQDYQNALKSGQDGYTQQGLENLKNLQAQYYAQYQEAAKQFSDFQAMVNADNLATEGSEYTTAKSYLDNAKDLYDKGLTGTPQFKAAAKYFSQNGFEDAGNFIENYNKLKNYYTDDASGPKRFLNDLQAKGLATYQTLEDGSKQWMYSFTDVQDAADAMGMSLESFNSMFGRLSDYNFTDNFVSSLEEGALKSDEIDDKLIDAQIKMGQMKASGASQSALDDQQAVIDDLISQKEGISQAISDFQAGTADRQIQEVKDAKGAIDELNQAMKDQNISPDSDAGKKYIEAIQEQADKVGLKLTNFEVDEDAYNQLIKQIQDQEEAKRQANKGSADLTNRPNVPTQNLRDVGWGGRREYKAFGSISDTSGDYATVFSSSYASPDGKKETLFTPIMANGDVYEPDSFKNYIDKYFKTGADPDNLAIRTFEGENAADQANAYASALHNVQEAYYGEDEAAKQSLDSLKDYTAQDLLGINYGDGKYDENFADAEKAVDGLVKQFQDAGLSEQDAQLAAEGLIQVLDDMGKLKPSPEVDTSGLDDAEEKADSTRKSYENLDGSTVSINADVSGADGAEQFIEQCKSIPQGMTTTITASVDGEDEVQSFEDGLEQIPDNTPTTVDVTVNNQEDLDNIQSKVDELNGDGKNITLKAHIQPTDSGELDVKAKDVKVKVSPEPKELTVSAAPVKATVEPDPNPIEVKATVEPSEVDAYLAEEKEGDGKVKWINDSGLVDVYAATEHYAHGTVHWGNDITAVKTSFTASGTVNWINAGGPSKKDPQATGTATSIAHASGTAYNVLNMKPLSSAHADGNVALKHDEQALVNEVGINGHSESIVRDGVWSLIPGGAHIENLKKGDIIFSATQTDALLKHGAIQGHARAYASGTVGTALLPAHAGNGSRNGGGNFEGGASSVKPVTDAIQGNTDSNNNLSDTISDSTDEVTSSLDDVLKTLNDNVEDWIEIALDRLDRYTSRYADLAGSDYSHLNKSDKYYRKAISGTESEITASKQAIARYRSYAEQIANNPTVSQYLTPDLKTKVQNGTIDIQSLSEDQKKAVEAYKTWYDKYLDAIQTYRDKKTQKLDYAKSRVDNVYDSYDTIIGKRENLEKYYAAKAENRIAHGKSQKKGSVYYNDLKKQQYYAIQQRNLTSKEVTSVRNRMTDYLADGGNKKDKAYQNMKKQLYELKTTLVEADTHVQESTQAIQDNKETLEQWQIDRWNSAGSKMDSVINYRKNADDSNNPIRKKDYDQRIKVESNSIEAMEKKRKDLENWLATHYDSPNNEEYKKKKQELDELNQSKIEAKLNMRQLGKEARDLQFKPFDKANEKLETFISECQTAQKLLGDSEGFYNEDGSLTENGSANVMLIQRQIDATKQQLANDAQALKNLDKMYGNGKNGMGFEEYMERRNEIIQDSQKAAANLVDQNQNMLNIYETQITKENDLLQENIDKRMEALEAKEDYYNYDKTLKKKSKDINTLKAQIAALEGTSSAAGKARLEKLKADLADAQDDMDDTIHSHKVDMQKSGLQKLQDDSNNNLDNTLSALKRNSDLQESVIKNMLKNVSANYDSTYSHLTDVMDQYGMKVSDTFATMTKKAKKFNTAAISATKAWASVRNMDTSPIEQGSKKANKAGQAAINRNSTAGKAGSQTESDSIKYKLKVSPHKVYLTYDGNRTYKLSTKWSPKTPPTTSITWKSSNEKVATVKNGLVTAQFLGKSSSSKNGNTTATLSTDTGKTYKCTITAEGKYKGAKDTCTVYVMPSDNYYAVKEYAKANGLKPTNSQIQDALEYSYQNGKGQDSSAAKTGYIKSALEDWFKALPKRSEGTKNIPAGINPLEKYFMQKGKKVTGNSLQKLAKILNITTPGADKYSKWSTALKNKLLKSYKSYGFSQGGIVRGGIPANLLQMIGADALVPKGDSMLIGANPGETVLTKEFTDQLKPTVATLNEFNSKIAKSLLPDVSSVQNRDVNVTNEYNFTFNNPVMNSEQNVQQLITKALKDHDKAMVRDFKKLR